MCVCVSTVCVHISFSVHIVICFFLNLIAVMPSKNNNPHLLLNPPSPDVTMAANFTISDSESEPSEEVEEGDNNQSSSGHAQQVTQGYTLTLPELRTGGR